MRVVHQTISFVHFFFFFSSRRRHTRCSRDWSSDVCSSDLCILDDEGQIRLHQNINTDPAAFLNLIHPYRQDIAVAVECMFTWYWIADFCIQENISFVLGHALYMKAIHGGKAKNDKIDSLKIATLLRGGMIPHAYVYPA